MAAHEQLSGAESEEECLLGEGTQIPGWENAVAASLTRQHEADFDTLGTWEARPPLGDILRPDDFNGSLIDIRIAPLSAPHGDLLSAARAGRRRSFARGSETLSEAAAMKIDPAHVRGYLLAATASSTKQPRVDDIYAQVWYVFRPAKAGTDPADVVRYVSEPVTDTDKFDALLARSIAAGRTLLSRFALHPIRGGGMSSSVRPSKLSHADRPDSSY